MPGLGVHQLLFQDLHLCLQALDACLLVWLPVRHQRPAIAACHIKSPYQMLQPHCVLHGDWIELS